MVGEVMLDGGTGRVAWRVAWGGGRGKEVEGQTIAYFYYYYVNSKYTLTYLRDSPFCNFQTEIPRRARGPI